MLALPLIVFAGCAEHKDVCTDAVLSLGVPTSVVAGEVVPVDYSYRTLDRAYNTLDVRVGSGILCSTGLSSTDAVGICSWNTNGLPPGEYSLELKVYERGTLSGAACSVYPYTIEKVQLLPAAPRITRQPESASVAEGAVASFNLAARGSGPLSYQWQKSIDAGTNWMDLPPGAPVTSYNTPPTTLADNGALFRARVDNPEGEVTSEAARLTVLENTCPVPPRAFHFVLADPVPVATGPATYGTNLLLNPGFEEPVYVGFAPIAFGYWRFDEAVSVPAQQGISPRSGARMLHLVGGSRDISAFGSGSASEQIQLVDLSALAADVNSGTVRARASAWFARVAGCAETDDAFAVHVIAFDGEPATFARRWTNGINAALAQGVDRQVADMTGVDGWLSGGYRGAGMRHNDPANRVGEVFDWRRVEAVLDVPPGTRFLAVIVLASENLRNDLVFPEFHGHYVDDAALWLEAR